MIPHIKLCGHTWLWPSLGNWFRGGQHSHVAVGLLLKAFVGRHAQRHLTHLAAETALVPVLESGREQKHEESTIFLRAFRLDGDGTKCIKHDTWLEKQEYRRRTATDGGLDLWPMTSEMESAGLDIRVDIWEKFDRNPQKRSRDMAFTKNGADFTGYRLKIAQRCFQHNSQWQTGKIPFTASTAAAPVSHLCMEIVPIRDACRSQLARGDAGGVSGSKLGFVCCLWWSATELPEEEGQSGSEHLTSAQTSTFTFISYGATSPPMKVKAPVEDPAGCEPSVEERRLLSYSACNDASADIVLSVRGGLFSSPLLKHISKNSIMQEVHEKKKTMDLMWQVYSRK